MLCGLLTFLFIPGLIVVHYCLPLGPEENWKQRGSHKTITLRRNTKEREGGNNVMAYRRQDVDEKEGSDPSDSTESCSDTTDH